MGRSCWLIFLVGCAAPYAGVRARGGEILKCPEQHLAVERQGEFEFKATGCGYSIALICATPDGQAPCTESPIARTPVYAPPISFVDTGRLMTAISEPILAPPPQQPYQRSYTPPPPPPPHIYMPGQYNPNTGTIQHDYAHQYTRPYTPPPVYHPPAYTPSYSYHH
jgi:hypothetical protein